MLNFEKTTGHVTDHTVILSEKKCSVYSPYCLYIISNLTGYYAP